MATAEECEKALHALADRMAVGTNAHRRRNFDRSLTCTLRDLDVTFGGRLHEGELEDIKQVEGPAGQIRLNLTSDDLLSLVDGQLRVATAWATGRIKVDAGIRDILRLRSMF